MKTNAIPKDVTDMSFENLTLVFGNRAGKAMAPVNPEATILATKAAEDKGMLARVTAAVQKALGKKADSEIEELIENAVDWAKRDAMYDLLWQFYYALGSVIDVPMIDADVKREAIDALCQEFGLRIAGFAGTLLAEKAAALELAAKSGARHNKQDLESIKAAHEQVGKARDALDKAQEATSRLLPDDEKPADDNVGASGEGSTAAANTDEVEKMTKDELNQFVGDAVKAALAEQKPSSETPAAVAAIVANSATAITKEDVAAAVKAAVTAAVPEIKTAVEAEFKNQLDAANARVLAAEEKATKASVDLDNAIKGARVRSAPGGHVDASETPAPDTRTGAERLAEATKAGTIRNTEDAIRLLSSTATPPKPAAV